MIKLEELVETLDTIEEDLQSEMSFYKKIDRCQQGLAAIFDQVQQWQQFQDLQSYILKDDGTLDEFK